MLLFLNAKSACRKGLACAPGGDFLIGIGIVKCNLGGLRFAYKNYTIFRALQLLNNIIF